MENISVWFSNLFRRVLPNSQAVSLVMLLSVCLIIVVTLGQMLMPVFAAGVIAYLLDGIVKAAESRKIPRLFAVILVFSGFLAFLALILFGLLPLLYQQSAQLIQQSPVWISRLQVMILDLPQQYPDFLSEEQLYELTGVLRRKLITSSQEMLTYSYSSLVSIITVVIYLILVPLLVFFFLKDKERILRWFMQYRPQHIYLSLRVWREVDVQIGNYVRGKIIEVLLLLVSSYITFYLMGLNYPLVLAFLIGISVIIPYVGATLVTFPVVLVAFFQWGTSDQFWYLMLAYLIIQAVDAVVLIPLLFSEVVNLHPVAIIVAILFFGGIWGFWGIFFAIPLATLVKAVLNAWPRNVVSKLRSPNEHGLLNNDGKLLSEINNQVKE